MAGCGGTGSAPADSTEELADSTEEPADSTEEPADPENKLPDSALTILREADQFELLSLDPLAKESHQPADQQNQKATFHGWKILGKTVLTAPKRKRVVRALLRGMANSTGAYKCFEPRHGIHATKSNASVDLMICFECEDIKLVGRDMMFMTDRTPEKVFNEILADAHIPIAPKRHPTRND
jgi:hypothetical protein